MLVGISITYCVVGGETLKAFADSITPTGGAHLGKWVYIIIFGGVQLFLSMVSATCYLFQLGCSVLRSGIFHSVPGLLAASVAVLLLFA